MSFEKASELKLRFEFRGLIATEDLWDLSLEDLDVLAKQLNRQVKSLEEESFIQKPSSANDTLLLKFEIVKRVIAVKLERAEESKNDAKVKARKIKLLEEIQHRENDLSDKGLDDLKAELEALG
jgi:hypothetical protein